MGLLSTTAPILVTSAAGIITTLAAAEFSACAPSWARRIVRRAARALPEEERAASEAEWLAHIDDVPGNVSKILHAVGLWQMASTRHFDIKRYLSNLSDRPKNPQWRLAFSFIGATTNAIGAGMLSALQAKHGSLYTEILLVVSSLTLCISLVMGLRAIYEVHHNRHAKAK